MSLDVFNLPPLTAASVEVFTGPVATVTNTQWITWCKPRGVSMIPFVGIGSGAGGGGGFSRAAGTPGGGAGGGGSAGMARVLVPAFLVPDVLYLQIGAGGVGGFAGNGSSGIQTYVSVFPSTVAGNVLLVSSNAAPAFGQIGTATAAGSGGTAATIATIANMPLAAMGIFSMIAGQVGSIGAPETGADGTSTPFPTTGLRVTSGAGGAGVTAVDFAGGIITPTANSYLGQQCAAAPAAGGNSGSGGRLINQPLFGLGGCGGGSSDTGTGGDGGNGGIGCGGGGAGAGVTGGRGGTGGSGLIAITCW